MLWRALGFPDVDDDKIAFTDLDVQALQTVQGLVELGVIDEETQLATTRAMGQSLSRLAEWQVSVLTTALGNIDEIGTEAATETARELVPVLEGLIGYVWRRHLAAAAALVSLVAAAPRPARADRFRYQFRPGQVIRTQSNLAGASLMVQSISSSSAIAAPWIARDGTRTRASLAPRS